MEEERVKPERSVRRSKPRSPSRREETYSLRDFDTKRLFAGFLIMALVLGGVGFWAKDSLPRFLSEQEEKAQKQSEKTGEVAGEVHVNLDGLQEQIDEIKKDVLQINVEDVKEQEAVKKILSDLEELTKKASESAKVFDVKGNVCGEAKRRFCE